MRLDWLLVGIPGGLLILGCGGESGTTDANATGAGGSLATTAAGGAMGSTATGATTSSGADTTTSSSTSGGSTTAGGTASSGGTSATGGLGGSGAGGSTGGGSSTGGTGGVGAAGSGGGATGTGGSAGVGNGSGGSGVGGSGATTGAECVTPEDCTLFEDCCTCRAVPVGATVAACRAACETPKCDQEGIQDRDIACVAGRCVINRSCDDSTVTCEVVTPACPAGTTPEVAADCYTGNCRAVEQCAVVASCDVCKEAGFACATYETQLGRQYHCVTTPEGCSASDCECMAVCSAIYVCGSGLTCSCPNC